MVLVLFLGVPFFVSVSWYSRAFCKAASIASLSDTDRARVIDAWEKRQCRCSVCVRLLEKALWSAKLEELIAEHRESAELLDATLRLRGEGVYSRSEGEWLVSRCSTVARRDPKT